MRKFLACISSNEKTPRHIIRKAARLASRYNTVFSALYVQTPVESTERINLASQRHLLNHFKLVTELGGEVLQVASANVLDEIIKTCQRSRLQRYAWDSRHSKCLLPYSVSRNTKNF